jgi:CP family cyanate transporter-like MFS transporter
VLTIPINAVVPALTVRRRLQRPLLLAFLVCYVAGWVGLWAAPRTAALLWMLLLGVGLGTFAMVLALIGLRARTPETTAALATVTQGWGYLISGLGPLLVGVLRGLTGAYDGMFVMMLIGVGVLGGTGWLVTQQRYVDDEVHRPVPDRAGPADVVEAAGAEAPVALHVTEPGAASPRE